MIEEIMLKIAEFLNIIILDNKFIFLNMWHLVHIISGIIIMFFIFRLLKKARGKLWILLGVLVIYEAIELFFVASGSNLFLSETKLDILGDLVFGFLGGLLIYFTYPKKKR